jgi:uncharacterized small protein (DUF1192 family)
MTLLKRFLFVSFLSVTSFGIGAAIAPSVAQASTAQDLIDTLDQRIAQLEAEIVALEAIINDPNSTTGEIIAAEAAKQQCLFRVAQAEAIQANAGFYDQNTLDFLNNLFQQVVSENAPKLGTI